MVTVTDRLLLHIQIKHAKAMAGLARFERRVQALQQRMQGFFQASQKLLLAVGLAFLFTGMALKRFFQTAVTSLLKLYMDMEGEQGVVNNKVNELKASLFAVGFALFDAFAESGMLDKWIDRIDRLVQWVNNLDEDTKAWLVNAAIWGAIAATAMMVIGMALLFFLGPLAMLELALPRIIASWSIMKAVAVDAIYKIVAAIFWLMANPIVLLIAGIATAIFGIYRMQQAVGGMGNFFKMVVSGMAGVLTWLGTYFINPIIESIEKLINLGMKAAAVMGRWKIYDALADISDGLSSARRFIAGGAMEKIDEYWGVPDIRNNMASTNMWDILKGGAANWQPAPQPQSMAPAPQINNTVIVEGSADKSTIEAAIAELERRIRQELGSPQF